MTTERMVGKITDAGVQDLRNRVGSYYRGGSTVRQVTEDLIRHYAIGMGSRSRLYLDKDYAAKTRYRGIIAPPTFLNNVHHTSGTPIGGLPGVQSFHGGTNWEWYRVIRSGECIGTSYRPIDIEEKPSEYAGRIVIAYAEILYIGERGDLIAKARGWSIRSERKAAQERGKYSKVEPANYTLEKINEIHELYDKEVVRGALPRYYEDTQIGEKLPSLVYGPLRVVDIAFIGGVYGAGYQRGAGGSTAGSHYYTFADFRKRAGYAELDPISGIADHPHRGHWEALMARLIGVPGIYDLAPQRISWLERIVSDWIGNEGFLRKLNTDIRRFNVEGDTTFIKGEVSRKWIEGHQHIVECELKGENQKGEVTCSGKAEAVLPSRFPDYEVPM
jgi:acyl dehydratase